MTFEQRSEGAEEQPIQIYKGKAFRAERTQCQDWQVGCWLVLKEQRKEMASSEFVIRGLMEKWVDQMISHVNLTTLDGSPL